MGRARQSSHDVVFYMPHVGEIIGNDGSRSAGGAERQVMMLAAQLAARGWQVGLVSKHVTQRPPPSLDGVDLVVHRPFRGKRRLSRRIARLGEMIRMFSTLHARAFVQRSAGGATGFVALAARLKRRRFVYSSANVVDFSFERLESSGIAVRLFHLGVRLADTIVVQTPEQVDLCRRRFGREPLLIKSLAEPQPLRVADPEAFLWAGRLAHYKHPEAMVRLAATVPEARFWVVAVATGPAEQATLTRLQAGARELPNLEVLPPRSREELGQLIDRAVAVVNTSQYEGMPNVFLEGWARGVPALSLARDPDGVIEREGVGAFAGGSDERFAELTRTMWRERRNQAALAERCRAYIGREHSSEAVMAQWEKALALPKYPVRKSLPASLIGGAGRRNRYQAGR